MDGRLPRFKESNPLKNKIGSRFLREREKNVYCVVVKYQRFIFRVEDFINVIGVSLFSRIKTEDDEKHCDNRSRYHRLTSCKLFTFCG